MRRNESGSASARRWAACACLSAAALMTGCRGIQSSLDPAGPQAERISRLWWLMLAICSAVFITVIAMLAYSLVKARRRNRVALEPERERSMARAVSGATIATITTVMGLLVASVLTGRAISMQPQDVLTIEVIGHQWWWEVQYDDPIPARTFKTANEIHIPVGQTVMIKLTSHDVIHSFWAPNFHGKKDLIPGHTTTLWIQADKPGTFRGQCAEFCGPQHAHMAFVVVAQQPDEFAAWYDKQLLPANQPADATQARGQQVFLKSRCIMCHTIRGTPAAAITGPDLTHIADRQTIAAATLPNTPDHLGGWILDSQSVKPGNKMPPNELNSEDLKALVNYLESLN